jgi:hypothetical protein
VGEIFQLLLQGVGVNTLSICFVVSCRSIRFECPSVAVCLVSRISIEYLSVRWAGIDC